jgi:hypothetical protein
MDDSTKLDAKLKHAVLQFKYNPTVDTFVELRARFETMVSLVVDHSPSEEIVLDKDALIGFLFCCIGDYELGIKFAESTFHYFMTQLLIRWREVYRMEKYNEH